MDDGTALRYSTNGPCPRPRANDMIVSNRDSSEQDEHRLPRREYKTNVSPLRKRDGMLRLAFNCAKRGAVKFFGFYPFNTRRFFARGGLYTIHNDEFRRDPRFREAYERGLEASRGVDQGLEWRVHVALWAAECAMRVPGDFVECGVNAGFVSSAIMRWLRWTGSDRKYYLIDTFSGPVLDQFSAEEVSRGWCELAFQQKLRGAYVTDLERVRSNFSEWPGAVVIKGAVPAVLADVNVPKVAFLHLDMNCAFAEESALNFFWGRLAPGAIVLLDDYAHFGCEPQKHSIDALARSFRVQVLSLPTGQGLIIR